MASTTSTVLSLSSSSALINAKAPPPRLQAAAAASQCAALTTPPTVPSSVHSSTHLAKTTAYCRKIARNVSGMATSTGEAPAEVVTTAETSEIIKTIQESWDKVEDKYAVASLAVAGGLALCAFWGMISAVERLPLVPGVLELVGIGYTGWFAYRNLILKPKREALIQKIKNTYCEITGTS